MVVSHVIEKLALLGIPYGVVGYRIGGVAGTGKPDVAFLVHHPLSLPSTSRATACQGAICGYEEPVDQVGDHSSSRMA